MQGEPRQLQQQKKAKRKTELEVLLSAVLTGFGRTSVHRFWELVLRTMVDVQLYRVTLRVPLRVACEPVVHGSCLRLPRLSIFRCRSSITRTRACYFVKSPRCSRGKKKNASMRTPSLVGLVPCALPSPPLSRSGSCRDSIAVEWTRHVPMVDFAGIHLFPICMFVFLFTLQFPLCLSALGKRLRTVQVGNPLFPCLEKGLVI